MSIVLTEVESIHGSLGQQRMIFYRCQDHLGRWHSYGPVITWDDNFDIEARRLIVGSRVEASLAAAEFRQAIE